MTCAYYSFNQKVVWLWILWSGFVELIRHFGFGDLAEVCMLGCSYFKAQVYHIYLLNHVSLGVLLSNFDL